MNKHEKKNDTIQISKATLIIIGIIIIGLAIIAIAFAIKGTSSETIVGAQGQVLTGSERTQAIKLLESKMESLSNKSLLISVDDSDNSITMLYNTHGEAIAEAVDTGVKTFYRNDNSTIQFSDSISFGSDSEILSLLKRGIELQKQDNLTVLKHDYMDDIDIDFGDMSTARSEVPVSYMIDIRGWDEITKLYSYVSDEFAEVMVTNLKENVSAIVDTEGSTIKDTDELNIRLEYTILNDELYSAACYVYFGDKESKYITYSDMQSNWYFEGYLEVYDWELSEDWYTTDWENINEDSIDAITDMFVAQYEELSAMLDKFAADNGYTDDSVSNEETEQTEKDSNLDLDESEQSESSESSESIESIGEEVTNTGSTEGTGRDEN